LLIKNIKINRLFGGIVDRGLKVPLVSEVLTSKVIAFRENFTTIDVVKAFNGYRISSAPVVNEQNEVVGYVSESDLIKCLGNCLFFDEQRNPTVDSIMSKEVLAVSPNWDLFELDNFFISNKVRSAPVVDNENHIIGVVTRRDALRALERVMLKRDEYIKDLKDPIELSMNQKIKLQIAQR
jgi:predicted transcriptional regulator